MYDRSRQHESGQKLQQSSSTSKRPIPPAEVMIPTRKGQKRVNLIKLDTGRYGYRVPSLNNQVIVEKRDEFGNIIKGNGGVPILIKHKYKFCDNVVEPDDKHWQEHMEKTIQEKHKTREGAFQKWIYPMGMVLLFITAIILLNMTTKQLSADKAMILEKATEAEADAKRTTENLNMLMEKITGREVVETDEPPDK